MGKFFVYCRIRLKFRFWLHKKCWHTSCELQFDKTSNITVIAEKPLTNLYEINSTYKFHKHPGHGILLFEKKLFSTNNFFHNVSLFQCRGDRLNGYFWNIVNALFFWRAKPSIVFATKTIFSGRLNDFVKVYDKDGPNNVTCFRSRIGVKLGASGQNCWVSVWSAFSIGDL